MNYIYFLQCCSSGNVKIGISADMDKRLRTLRNHNSTKLKLVAVIRGEENMEQHFHSMFAGDRIGTGEWFAPSPGLLQLIEEISVGDKRPEHFVPLSRGRKNKPARTEMVVKASEKLRMLAPKDKSTGLVRDAIVDAAKLVGLGYWRAFDIWYANARTIEAHEFSQICAAYDAMHHDGPLQ